MGSTKWTAEFRGHTGNRTFPAFLQQFWLSGHRDGESSWNLRFQRSWKVLSLKWMSETEWRFGSQSSEIVYRWAAACRLWRVPHPSAWGKVTARSVQGQQGVGTDVAFPDSTIFGGRVTVGSRENAKKKNSGRLAVISPEIWAIYTEVRICFSPGRLFKICLGVWQRNENHESVVTTYEWNFPLKTSFGLGNNKGRVPLSWWPLLSKYLQEAFSRVAQEEPGILWKSYQSEDDISETDLISLGVKVPALQIKPHCQSRPPRSLISTN